MFDRNLFDSVEIYILFEDNIISLGLLRNFNIDFNWDKFISNFESNFSGSVSILFSLSVNCNILLYIKKFSV